MRGSDDGGRRWGKKIGEDDGGRRRLAYEVGPEAGLEINYSLVAREAGLLVGVISTNTRVAFNPTSERMSESKASYLDR